MARVSVVPGVMDVLGKCQILVNWCLSRHDVFHGPCWWGHNVCCMSGFNVWERSWTALTMVGLGVPAQ